MRTGSLVPLGFGLVLGAVAITAIACNKPDPNATSADAGYVETVTTASAGATAIPPTNAPGGNYDGGAASTADASATAFAQACAGPAPTSSTPFHQACAPAASQFNQACAGPGPTPAASPSSAPAAPACGDKPLPACPMTAWMKANAGPASANADSDLPTLANVLDKIATFAPPGYTNWVSISKDGAAAARAGQLDAARASCRTCHTQYKAKYKAEIRSRPLP